MNKPFSRFALALLLFAALAPFAPAKADSASSNAAPRAKATAWLEEWDPAARRWVRLDAARGGSVRAPMTASADARRKAFGPFVVLDATTAALVNTTDSQSPDQFARMLQAFPGIARLDLIDAPGTVHDVANLAVGRLIRAAGIATHVPANGSVRSGAVELFLAGVTHSMEPGARFAVHAWQDERGRGPHDFAPGDPVNRLYTSYYEEMGMSAADAQAFYAMTNSVPHASALWFGPETMRGWTERRRAQQAILAPKVQLAYDWQVLRVPVAKEDGVAFNPWPRLARNL